MSAAGSSRTRKAASYRAWPKSGPLKGVRSLVAEDAIQGRIDLSGRVEVVDSEGRAVFTLTFSDAVEILR